MSRINYITIKLHSKIHARSGGIRRVVSEEDMHVVFVCFHCHDFVVMGISEALNLLFYGINP